MTTTPRRRVRPILLALLLVASSPLGGCTAPAAHDTPAPALAGADLDGTPRDLADYRGSVVLVNVWASWCAPCREEMPLLQTVQAQHDVEVLGINMRDRTDPAGQLLREQGVTYPNVVDPDGTTSVEWGVAGIPMTFVVDRDGRIVDRRAGAVTQEWIDQAVLPRVQS